MTTQVMIDIAGLQWLARQGAAFALPYGRTKDKFEKGWPDKPHTLEDAITHAKRAGNVGILTGKHSSNIIALDRDVDFSTTVDMLGAVAQTAKIIRDNAPERGKLLYRVRGDLPKSTVWKPRHKKDCVCEICQSGILPKPVEKHPHAELLSDGRHALAPTSSYDTGHYLLQDTDLGILEVTPEQLDRIWWMITGNHLYASTSSATAEHDSASSSTDSISAKEFVRQVKDAWATIEVFKRFHKDEEGIGEKPGRVHVRGNGGLVVNEWRWFCHADNMGGDQIDAWYYCKTGEVFDRSNRKAFWDTVNEMADAAGIVRPARPEPTAKKETYTNGHSNHTAKRAVDMQTGEIVEEEPEKAPQAKNEPNEADKEHLTDLGNGKRIARLHGQKLRYTQAWGWSSWDGARWKRDETGEIMRVAKQTALGFFTESARVMDKAKALVKAAEDAASQGEAEAANKHSEKAREFMKMANALSAHAQKSQARARLEAMIALALSEFPIAAHSDDFDKNLWALNVKNGTIDLKTGKLHPHRKEDLISKIAPVVFDPHATCPTWLAFLNRIMDGNQEVIDFLQRAMGYSLTGSTVDHALFFTYGTGQNGKSTFFETLAALLGGYWQKAPTEILMVKERTSGIPNDIARLVGLRMVVVAEVEEGSRMAEKQVKDLTGGDTLVARFLNKEFFEFTPTHKVWMYGNHKPTIRGTDTGIWRRVNLIPFTVTIPKEERDSDLKNKLAQELPGIMAWGVRGCLDWQRDGLNPPLVVQNATEEYKTDSDTFSAFLSECTIKHELAKTRAGKLYLAYETWCKENGEKPIGGKRFGQQLVEHGFKKHEADGRFVYNGIGLLVAE